MSARIAVPGEDTVLSDRYRLVHLVGAGGMGSVWEADDLLLKRSVAVKLVHGAQREDEVVLARFTREARTAARLSHPNLAMVFDYGESPEGLYLVMELLQGQTLAERLHDGPMPPNEAAGVIAEAAAALAVVHAAGVVHRDVKPANLMLTGAGVKVMDFGIASGIGEALTATGLVIGTAAYLAPERVQGQTAGPPADVYALGAVLYECLTGTPAFAGDTPAEVAMGHVHRPPPDPADIDPTVPTNLVAACREALAKDPEVRPTAAALADLLRDVPATRAAPMTVVDPTLADAVPATAVVPVAPVTPDAPPPPGPRREPTRSLAPILVVVAVVAILAGGAFALTRDTDPAASAAVARQATSATTAPSGAPSPAPATTAAPPTTAPATTAPPATGLVPAPTGELADAAIGYLGLLDAGDFDGAWAATSPAFQAAQDQESWRSFWGGFESIAVVGEPQVDESAQTVVVPVSFDGGTEDYQLTFVAGPSGWLVDGPVGG